MAATRSSLPKSPFFKLVAAGEGIWAAVATDFTAAVGNSAIVDLGGRWLVVDTFMSARAATDLHEVVRSLAGDQPLWVVNTHSHMDHVGGNSVFAAAATIAATGATRERVLETAAGLPERVAAAEAAAADARAGEDEESVRRHREAEARLDWLRRLQLVAPNATIGDRLTLFGQRRRADLIALGTAHTNGDLAIHLPDDRMLLAGDVVVNHTLPAVQDGDAVMWLGVLARLRALGAATVLTGHGEVGDAATIDEMEVCLSALLADANAIAQDPGAPAPAVPERLRAWRGAQRWPELVALVASREAQASLEASKN
jgi:glyoxylase-like metal-dependent hydrolase (beta-lactamase superfamily II)